MAVGVKILMFSKLLYIDLIEIGIEIGTHGWPGV
jgi:hypothetical protein